MPKPHRDALPGYEHMMAYLDGESFKPKLHRWRFNMRDGTTKEERLDDANLEFGMFNQGFAGKPYRSAYSTTMEPGWFLFNGFVRHDLKTGRRSQFALERGRYASEAPVAPRLNAREEDDGYLVRVGIG